MLFNKSIQADLYNISKEHNPENYKFWPETYILPRDREQALKAIKEREASGQAWVYKLSMTNQGSGATIFASTDEFMLLNPKSDAVLQSYVSNPLLINNKKFDCRIYVVVVGVNPMKAYVSADYGNVKCCAGDYSSDFADKSCQVTNRTFNKHHPDYVEEENTFMDGELPFCSSMHISTGWKFIKRNYPEANIEEMKSKIVETITHSLRALRPSIEVKGGEQFDINMYPHINKKVFQIYGYDIMFDTDFNIHLFEANRAPTFLPYILRHGENGEEIKVKSTTDEINIKTILPDALRIAILNQEPKVLKKCYDSSEGSDADYVFEKVVTIFKKLAGRPMRTTLTCDMLYENFHELSTPDLDLSKVELDSAFSKMFAFNGKSLRALTPYDFFKFLALIAEQLNLTLENI